MNSYNRESVYLDDTSVNLKKRSFSSFQALLMSSLALFILVIGILPFTTLNKEMNGNPTQASAGLRILCQKDLGTQMGSPDSWGDSLGSLPASDKNGRILNVREAFGSGAWFVSYNGEGDGDSWTNQAPADRADGKISDDVKTKAEGVRSGGECMTGFALTGAANLALGFAKVITNITGNFATFAFSSNIVCAEPGSGGACFDLLKIIGGESVDDYAANKNEGLIGSLTNGIYLPLLTLVAAFSALKIAYEGIVQRKFRDALYSALWVTFSVIFGLLFLFRPALLAKAPAAVSNTISACVISAFSGTSCLNPIDPKDYDANNPIQPCTTLANDVTINEQMELISASLTCSVWKAFILEPYARGSFGQSFEELYTVAPGRGGLSTNINEVYEDDDQSAYGAAKGDFCVNTRAQGTLDSMANGTLALGDGNANNGSMCNILLYQLYLKTDALMAGGSVQEYDSEGSQIDRRWYKIVQVAGSSDHLWSNWADGSGYISKVLLAFITILASALGGVVIGLVAVFAIMYYVSSIFLMAFAPLFFLIGVHPGRGREILKGYGGIVLSNVFKYVASSLFLVVTLAIYGGVLGTSSNLGITLLFVIILSVALLLYRKEIIELIGKVDLGGKALSNKLSEYGKDVGKFGAITAGGAVGGTLAAGGLRPSQWKEGLKGGISGAGRTVKREAMAGRIPVGGDLTKAAVRGTTRAFDQTTRDQGAQFAKDVNTAQADADEALNNSLETGEELDEAVTKHNTDAAALEGLEKEIMALKDKLADSSLEKTLEGIEKQPGGAEFVQAAKLNNDIKGLEDKKELALASGDNAAVANIDAQLASKTKERNDLVNGLRESGQLESLQEKFKNAGQQHNYMKKQLDKKIDEHKKAAAVVEADQAEVDRLSHQYGGQALEARLKGEQADELSGRAKDRMTSRKVAKAERKGIKAAREADATEHIDGTLTKEVISRSRTVNVNTEEYDKTEVERVRVNNEGTGGIPIATSGTKGQSVVDGQYTLDSIDDKVETEQLPLFGESIPQTKENPKPQGLPRVNPNNTPPKPDPKGSQPPQPEDPDIDGLW